MTGSITQIVELEPVINFILWLAKIAICILDQADPRYIPYCPDS
jgi:hypothetical protein